MDFANPADAMLARIQARLHCKYCVFYYTAQFRPWCQKVHDPFRPQYICPEFKLPAAGEIQLRKPIDPSP